MLTLLKERIYSEIETYVAHETFLINHSPSIMKRLCQRDPKYLKYVKGNSATAEMVDLALSKVEDKDHFIINEILYQGNDIERSSDAMKRFCEINGTNFTASHASGITFENFLIAINHPNYYKRLDPERIIGTNKFVFYDVPEEELKKFCEYDGRFLYGIRSKDITLELLTISLTNPNPNKRPNLLKVPSIRHNISLMNKLVELDGQNFIYALNEAANESLLEKALNHPNPNKRLSFDRIPQNFNSSFNYNLIKSLIAQDERWIKYVYIDTITSQGLIKKMQVDKDFIPTIELIEKFKNNKDVLITFYEEIEKGHYTLEQVSEICSIYLDHKIINDESFQKITKYLCEKNNVNYEFFKEHITKAISLNDEVLKTLLFEFLQERYHKIYQANNFERLYTLIIYPYIQSSIIRIGKPVNNGKIDYALGDKKIELLSRILNLPNQYNQNKHLRNWTSYYMKVINSFEEENELYTNIANNLSQIDNNLLKLLASYATGKHPYKIDNIDDLIKYDEIRNKWIEENLKSNNIDQVREAVLEKVFGISFHIANEFHIPYTEGILKGKDYFHPAIVEFFKLLNIIMKEEKIDILRDNLSKLKPKINLKDKYAVDLRGIIKKQYIKAYNDTLFKIDNHKPDDSISGIKLYKAAGPRGNQSFNISLTALGAYTGFDPLKEGYNYKNDWNRPKIMNHGICTSYIGNNSIGVASTHYSILGFTDYEDDALLLSGPADIYSINESFDVSGDEDGKSRYLLPTTMIDETRHNHNEMVMERKVENEKRKPSYVVLVCNDYSKIKREYVIQKSLGRYIGRRDNLYGKPKKDSDLLHHALETAKDFDIPIVIVEREKIALSEHLKIRESLSSLKDNSRLNRKIITSYFYSLITNFENNHAGNMIYHSKINRRYFPKMFAEDINADIKDEISFHLQHNPINGFIMLEEFEKISMSEKKKYKGDNYRSGFNYDQNLDFCKKSREHFLNKIPVPEAISYLLDKDFNDESYLMEYNAYLNSLITKKQLSITEIKKILSKEIIDQIMVTINETDRYHFQDKSLSFKRHITNVSLFSIIIAYSFSLSKEDTDLLLLASLYHKYEDDSNNPKISSNIAKELLKINTPEEDIKIVQTIIEYTGNKDKSESKLEEISKNLGLDITDKKLMSRVKQLSYILDDANSLDDTRYFVKSNSFLNTNLLHYPISHRLIKFGMQLNECYAANDIKDIYGNDFTMQNYLNKTKSPKLVFSIYNEMQQEAKKNKVKRKNSVK